MLIHTVTRIILFYYFFVFTNIYNLKKLNYINIHFLPEIKKKGHDRMTSDLR